MTHRRPTFRLLHLASALVAAAVGACSSPAPYHCAIDQDCNATSNEACIDGFCAAAVDVSVCPSGWQYTRTAQNPNACAQPNEVLDGPPIDATDEVPADEAAMETGVDSGNETGVDASMDHGNDAGVDIVDVPEEPQCVPATEVCDGMDNDCNGMTDEHCPSSITVNNLQAGTPVGITGSMSFNPTCPSGKVLTGVAYNNACPIKVVGLICSSMSVVQRPGGSVPFEYDVALTQDSTPVGVSGCTSTTFGTPAVCSPGQIVTSLSVVTDDVTSTGVQTFLVSCATLQIQRSGNSYALVLGTAGPGVGGTCFGGTHPQGCGGALSVGAGLIGTNASCTKIDSLGLRCEDVALRLQ